MTKTEAKRAFLFFGVFLTTLASVKVVSDDVALYYNNVEGPNCCGYVEPGWFNRPFTYLMVDEWTEPKWTVNAAGTEEWLVSDGLVDGKVEFWTKLDENTL
jgi:hypothetical protein